jgi:hypothetical protein
VKAKIPEPQGNTPMQRMDWAFRTALKVPKDALLKEERRIRRKRRKKSQEPS